MRINYITNLRAFAAFCVVFIHVASGLLDSGMPLPHGGAEMFFLEFYRHVAECAVPVFVMITGTLLLNSDKDIPYKIIFNKYIWRIFMALIIFGLPMNMLELYSQNIHQNFILVLASSFISLIKGKCWAHMWYLYMLIGLYLLLPLFKKFINYSSIVDEFILLAVLFVMGFIIPTINSYSDSSLNNWMILPPYLCMLVAGDVLSKINTVLTSWSKLIMGGLLIIFCIILILLKVIYHVHFNFYIDPILLFLATGLYLIFMSYDGESIAVNKISRYSFAIYIVHPLFVNIIYKVFKINFSEYASSWYYVPLVAVFIWFLSLLFSIALFKISFLKQNVL